MNLPVVDDSLLEKISRKMEASQAFLWHLFKKEKAAGLWYLLAKCSAEHIAVQSLVLTSLFTSSTHLGCTVKSWCSL